MVLQEKWSNLKTYHSIIITSINFNQKSDRDIIIKVY